MKKEGSKTPNQLLQGLYQAAIEGNFEAGAELSRIALGGNKMARRLTDQMDRFFCGPVPLKSIPEQKAA